MGFGQILAKRVGYGLVLLIAVVVLNFTLITIAPGDVADAIAGDMGGADASVLVEIRQRYGLDQPFMSQLWRYLSSVAVMGFRLFVFLQYLRHRTDPATSTGDSTSNLLFSNPRNFCRSSAGRNGSAEAQQFG